MKKLIQLTTMIWAVILTGDAIAQNVEYVGSYDSLQQVHNVFVVNNYVYIADSSGLDILDASNPQNPILIGNYSTSDWALDVFVSGNYAYLVGYSGSLMIIDVSNPLNPTLTGSYVQFFSNIFVLDNFAYLVSWADSLMIINVSDPQNPTYAGAYGGPNRGYRDVFMSDNYAYLISDSDGLEIIDMSNPSNPERVGQLDLLSASSIFVSGNYAYTGLQIIDIGNPQNPVHVSYFWHLRGIPDGIFTLGNYAYLATNPYGLQIVHINDPQNPTQAGDYETPGFGYGVFVSGDYVYLADYYSLQILRFTPNAADNPSEILPQEFSLSQNCPNPFNATTMLNYSLSRTGQTELTVYNIAGQKAVTLFSGVQQAGEHRIEWNAENFPSGVYFAKLETSSGQIRGSASAEIVKMVLLK